MSLFDLFKDQKPWQWKFNPKMTATFYKVGRPGLKSVKLANKKANKVVKRPSLQPIPY